MDLVKRYVRSVGIQLPAEQRDDVESELQSLIEDAVEGKHEELGRELNETELAELIKTFGHPARTAAGYLGNHGLIGPELFPLYKLALKISFSIIAIVYVLLFFLPVLTVNDLGSLGFFRTLIGLPVKIGYAWLFWFAIITIGFAIAEREQVDGSSFLDKWNPLKLPDWKTSEPSNRGEVFAEIFWLIIFLLLFNNAIQFAFFFNIEKEHFDIVLSEDVRYLIWPINFVAILWLALLSYVFVNNIWNRITRSMNLILNIAALGIVAVLLSQSPLLDILTSTELTKQMSVAPELLLKGVLVIILLFTLYDGAVDAYKLFMMQGKEKS